MTDETNTRLNRVFQNFEAFFCATTSCFLPTSSVQLESEPPVLSHTCALPPVAGDATWLSVPLPQAPPPRTAIADPRPLWHKPWRPLGAVELRVQRRCILVPELTRLRLCRCSLLRNTLPCGVRRSQQVINNQ